MSQLYAQQTKELITTLKDSAEFHLQLERITSQFKQTFAANRKALVAGNGGSAAQAQHLADEMLGRYKNNRQPYPVIALSADGAVVTCIGNDFGFENIFARQIKALGEEGDIYIGLTTSGSSKNILAAATAAREQGMTVIAFTGQKGNFKDIADYTLTAPSKNGARIQEIHLHAIHLLCEEFENQENHD